MTHQTIRIRGIATGGGGSGCPVLSRGSAAPRILPGILPGFLAWIGLFMALLPGFTGAADLREVRGMTEPYRNLLVKAPGKRNPPWTSQIETIQVAEGDLVEVGQILIELEKDMQVLELELRTLVAENTAELVNAREREQRLQSFLEDTRKAYEKTRSISREDLNSREVALLTARAERLRLELAKQQEKIEVKIAAANLEQQSIRSPIRGTVLEILLREGESSAPGDPLLRIVDTSRGYLVGNVEEPIGRTLKRGDPVDVRIDAGASHVDLPATIAFVSPVVDSASGLMPVKVEFSNADGRIRPGVAGSIFLPAGSE